MAEKKLNFAKGLSDAEAHREIFKTSLDGELVSFRYNARTGVCNISTRAIPAFPDALPESEESKIVNALMETAKAQASVIEADRIALDKREADILEKERSIDDDRKEIENERRQLAGERRNFEREQQNAQQGGFVGRVKSFFHRQS